MKLHDLRPANGAKKARKRVARGPAAGGGKTAGRGTKGQNARSGGGVRPYFEGGQLPLVRRLPYLRGFTNPSRVEYSVVNVQALNRFEVGTEVTPELLDEMGLVKNLSQPIKILGQGELDRALTVKANRFSASAKEKIAAAGGTAEEI
jgi:large subunit ribosomal protein L15